jgi:hypothetical protein
MTPFQLAVKIDFCPPAFGLALHGVMVANVFQSATLLNECQIIFENVQHSTFSEGIPCEALPKCVSFHGSCYTGSPASLMKCSIHHSHNSSFQ